MSDDNMNEQAETIEGQETFDGIDLDDLTEDQKRIAAWHKAAAQTPTVEDVNVLRAAISDAQQALRDAQDAYEEAVALRGRVYGWKTVAAEEGEDTRKIHYYRRTHIPDLEDLSTVPEREMVREERRIAAAEERAQREAALRDRLLAQKARIDAIRGDKHQ